MLFNLVWCDCPEARYILCMPTKADGLVLVPCLRKLRCIFLAVTAVCHTVLSVARGLSFNREQAWPWPLDRPQQRSLEAAAQQGGSGSGSWCVGL